MWYLRTISPRIIFQKIWVSPPKLPFSSEAVVPKFIWNGINLNVAHTSVSLKNSNVVHLQLRGKLCGVIGVPWPIAADGTIYNHVKRLVERCGKGTAFGFPFGRFVIENIIYIPANGFR